MLSVCTRGLRVTQFQFSVCMYGTCGRIDNKADFNFDFLLVFCKDNRLVLIVECLFVKASTANGA